MSDLISRQAAIDAIMGQPPEPHYPSWYAEQIKNLPSAQPEILACGNGELNAQPEQLERCPIYDGVCAYPSDRCYECPRHYGAQSEQRWIPFKTRPLTKEEKEEHPEWDVRSHEPMMCGEEPIPEIERADESKIERVDK